MVLHGQTDLYPVELGEWVSVGHRATLHGCIVEDRCLIGIGAIVLNGARIGHDSIIAAGTLIPEHAVVEPFSLMMGSPGKLRRVLGEREREAILMPARNYLVLRERYLKERAAKPPNSAITPPDGRSLPKLSIPQVEHRWSKLSGRW